MTIIKSTDIRETPFMSFTLFQRPKPLMWLTESTFTLSTRSHLFNLCDKGHTSTAAKHTNHSLFTFSLESFYSLMLKFNFKEYKPNLPLFIIFIMCLCFIKDFRHHSFKKYVFLCCRLTVDYISFPQHNFAGY